MKNRMKIFLSFGVMIILTVCANAQIEESIKVFDQSGINYNVETTIKLQMNYTPQVKFVRVILPEGFTYPKGDNDGDGESEGDVLGIFQIPFPEKDSDGLTASGREYWDIKYSSDFVSSELFDLFLYHINTPVGGCLPDVTAKIDVQLLNTDKSVIIVEDEGDIGLSLNKGTSISRLNDNRFEYCSETEPFQYEIIINKSSLYNASQFKVSIDVEGTPVECIAINYKASSSIHNNSPGTIIDETSSIKSATFDFSSTTSTTQYVSFYFDVLEKTDLSKTSFNFSPKISVEYLTADLTPNGESCNEIEIHTPNINIDYCTNEEDEYIGDNGFVNRPDIDTRLIQTCSNGGACGISDASITHYIDNTFTSNVYGASTVFEFEIPADININTLSFNDVNGVTYSGNVLVSFGIADPTTGNVTYTTPETLTISSSKNIKLDFSSDMHSEFNRIRFSFSSLGKEELSISYSYESDPDNINEEDNLVSTLSEGDDFLDTDIELFNFYDVNNANCLASTQFWDYYLTENVGGTVSFKDFNDENRLLLPDNEYRVSLRIHKYRGILELDDFTFDYILNENLSLVDAGLVEFSVVNSSNLVYTYSDELSYLANFELEDDFKQAGVFSNFDFSYDPVDRKMTFSGIDYPCGNNTYFICTFKVRTKNSISASSAHTSTISNNIPSVALTSWQVPQSFNIEIDNLAQCDNLLPVNELNSIVGEDFDLVYVLNNEGNTDLKGVNYIAALPHENGQHLVTNTNLSSDISLSCPTEDVRVYISGQTEPLIAGTDYELEFTSGNNICLDDVNFEEGTCQTPSWASTCSNNNTDKQVFIKVTTKDVIIPAFGGLSIYVPQQIANSASLGNGLYSTSIANAISTDNTASLPVVNEESIAKVTVSEESSCQDDACKTRIAFVIDESGSIDGTEAGKIREGLISFVNTEVDKGVILSLIAMGESSGDDENHTLELELTQGNRSQFLSWINAYKNGRSGRDYWDSGLNVVVSGLIEMPDIVFVITDGMKGNKGDVRDDIAFINSNNSHVHIYGITSGSYGGNGNLNALLDELYDNPVQSIGTTDLLTSDFHSLTNFDDLGDEIAELPVLLEASNVGCFSVDPPECSPQCIPSFSPQRGEKYVLNAWVKEKDVNGPTYENAAVTISFKDAAGDLVFNEPYFGQGQIIDGWQRIESIFVVPDDAVDITVELTNNGSGKVYFDDIRVHRFNGNMKSFVYDPITLRLMAEMDERNYATFYEYDEEGALTRVKKETVRGVKTIQESRNNSSRK